MTPGNDISKMSLHELLKYTSDMTDMINENRERPLICFNHVLERYLYEYWNDTSSDRYDVSRKRYNEAYIHIGSIYHSSGDTDNAVSAYKNASACAPADLDAKFSLAMEYRDQGRWDDMRSCISETYDYIFTKTDMAQYYRYMGCFELEKYHPDKALALYRYSNLFSSSQTADAEIGFLKKAGTDMTEMNTERLRILISGENIPLQPDPDTIGITFKVGKNEIEDGNVAYGRMLMKSVYELTGDEEAHMLMLEKNI